MSVECVYCHRKAPLREMVLSVYHKGRYCCRRGDECLKRRLPWK